MAANLNNIGSKLAIRQRNDTILGVKHCLIQLFKNPHGICIVKIVHRCLCMVSEANASDGVY